MKLLFLQKSIYLSLSVSDPGASISCVLFDGKLLILNWKTNDNYLLFDRISWNSSKLIEDKTKLLYSNSCSIIFSSFMQMVLLWQFHSERVPRHVPLHGNFAWRHWSTHFDCLASFCGHKCNNNWISILLQKIENYKELKNLDRIHCKASFQLVTPCHL